MLFIFISFLIRIVYSFCEESHIEHYTADELAHASNNQYQCCVQHMPQPRCVMNHYRERRTLKMHGIYGRTFFTRNAVM